MALKKPRSNAGQEKRKVTRRTLKIKKEIITKHENGVCISDLAAQYGMAKSTICLILKNKEMIKVADVFILRYIV